MTRSFSHLRLNSVERFHFLDDSPEYPNNIFARLFFSGTLDETWAKQAFEIAMGRHPLPDAMIRNGRWDSAPELRPRFFWNRGMGVASQWINLQLEKPSRIHFHYHSDRNETEVLLQVHHAAVDGQGGLQFTREWMKIYDNLANGRPGEDGLPELSPQQLRQRNKLQLFSTSGLKTLLLLPIGMFGAFKFLFRKPTPLIKLRPLEDDTLKDDFPCVATYEISRQQMPAIKAYVKQQKITLNDWLISCCYQSLMYWREQFRLHRSQDWYRIIVPMSVRSFRDRGQSACNRAAVIQLDRREADIVNAQHLGHSVSYEMGFIRNGNLQKIFLMVIKTMSAIPFLLRSRAKQKKCRAMAVVTNVGRPFLKTGLESKGRMLQMGGSQLLRAEMVPPIRYGTPVTFAIAQYAGRLFLTMHVDTRYIKLPDAEKLLEDYGNRVANVPVAPDG